MNMSDGGLVSLDWFPKRPSSEAVLSADVSIGSYTIAESIPTSIVIVLPASMGSSSEYRIRTLAKSLSANGPSGCHVVVLNHRGFARTPMTTPRVPSFHYTSDLHELVEHLSQEYPGTSLGAIGYSMGANILTKYLGEQGKECKLSAATTICCPFDVTKLYNAIAQPTLFNTHVLQPALTGAAVRFAKRNSDAIQSGPRKYDLDSTFQAKTVLEVDKLLTAPNAGFSSREGYYRQSSSRPYVSKIATPLLAINSRDDPMVPVDAIPIEVFRTNPYTTLLLTNHGGHLGFLTGAIPRIWYIDPVAHFFRTTL
ncbi:medium-chain fatty acid ethyl ester synthase/esterase 2 [Coemansia sp. RSA 485]|nr:medium-chain fatty acid ethyl ester synthase/esterase 2 [Coemansia sp. RSA 485]